MKLPAAGHLSVFLCDLMERAVLNSSFCVNFCCYFQRFLAQRFSSIDRDLFSLQMRLIVCLAIFLLAHVAQADWDGCTAIAVGRKASVDGSLFTTHKCAASCRVANVVPATTARIVMFGSD